MSTGFPILLSLRVGLLAMVIIAPAGLALAWVQARRRYRLRSVVDGLILLPLVLPPSVVGFFLVFLMGRRGPIGGWLADTLGIKLIFTPTAAVIASAVVAFPLLVKAAQAAIAAVPVEVEDVGRTLGLGGIELFVRVTLPSAWRGILAGLVLAGARAMGEFGATLMFAGNIPGRTNTMPVEIFAAYQAGNDSSAFLYVAVLTGMSIVVTIFASTLSPKEAHA